VEARLLGTWHCQDSEEQHPVDLTFADFDGRQYLLQVDEHSSTSSSSRAVAGRVGSLTYLSVREVFPTSEGDWTVFGYSFGDAELRLEYVDPDPFEDVIDDSQAVRDRLSALVQDPEVVQQMFSCTRVPPKSPSLSPR
jgi:hypothetical protein